MDPILWIGIVIAVVVGGAGVLYAVYKDRGGE